jgi:hypothetical protein
MNDNTLSPKLQVDHGHKLGCAAHTPGSPQCGRCLTEALNSAVAHGAQEQQVKQLADHAYRLVGENAQQRLYRREPSPEMPPQPAPVEHMLNLQRAGMETLHTLVSVLEGRLERVLSAPQNTSPSHVQDLDGSGKLPQEMANVRASMVDLADRLESLTQRLLV